jgi:hypothetical protein
MKLVKGSSSVQSCGIGTQYRQQCLLRRDRFVRYASLVAGDTFWLESLARCMGIENKGVNVSALIQNIEYLLIIVWFSPFGVLFHATVLGVQG